MYPTLFRLGGFTVTSYGVMLVLAFIASGFVVAAEFRRRGWDAGAAQDIVLAAMAGGVIGSKLYWALDNWVQLSADPLGTLFSRGGFTYYGGLAGGIFGVVGYLLWKRYPMGEAINACTPAVPVGYILGRVGCFLVGDDYGRPTDAAWGIAFPEGSPPTVVPVHPTQLYEIALTVPIFLLLWMQRTRNLPGWFLFWEFCALAGLERFFVEFYRVNPVVGAGLTAAQWLSLAMVAFGVAGMGWVFSRSPRDGRRAPAPSPRPRPRAAR